MVSEPFKNQPKFQNWKTGGPCISDESILTVWEQHYILILNIHQSLRENQGWTYGFCSNFFSQVVQEGNVFRESKCSGETQADKNFRTRYYSQVVQKGNIRASKKN